MSAAGTWVGDLAYQGVLAAKFSVALKGFAQTANRYALGLAAYTVSEPASGSGTMSGIGGRTSMARPGLGAANTVTSTAGTGFVVGDTITFAPVNGGRPIVVRVVTAPGGVPGSLIVIDGGNGLIVGNEGTNNNVAPAGTVLTVASTSGVGVGGVFTAHPGFGWAPIAPNANV